MGLGLLAPVGGREAENLCSGGVCPVRRSQLHKIFSINLQVTLTDSCPVNSCNFGVPESRGWQRVSYSTVLLSFPQHINFKCLKL